MISCCQNMKRLKNFIICLLESLWSISEEEIVYKFSFSRRHDGEMIEVVKACKYLNFSEAKSKSVQVLLLLKFTVHNFYGISIQIQELNKVF